MTAEESSPAHELSAIGAVGDIAVDAFGNSIEHAVQREKQAENGFFDVKLRLHHRHGDGDVFPYPVKHRIAGGCPEKHARLEMREAFADFFGISDDARRPADPARASGEATSAERPTEQTCIQVSPSKFLPPIRSLAFKFWRPRMRTRRSQRRRDRGEVQNVSSSLHCKAVAPCFVRKHLGLRKRQITNLHESTRIKKTRSRSFIREDSCEFVQIRDLSFGCGFASPRTLRLCVLRVDSL